MATSIDKKAIGLVLGLLGAFALFAALAPAAQATQVVTPGSALPTTVEIDLAPNTTSDFHPSNAYASIWIECDGSHAEFTIVEENNDENTNRPGTGDHSDDHGSVGVPLDPNPNDAQNDRVATFSSCTVEHETFGTVDDATVTTNDTNGAWSVSAHHSDTRSPMLAIGVPADGAEIVMDANDCTITVSHHEDTFGMTSAVMAEYDNDGGESHSRGQAYVDEQIHFIQSGDDCQGSSPAQYEATYEPDVDVDVNE